MTPISRKVYKIISVVCFISLVLFLYALSETALRDSSHLTGWILVASILFLSIFSLRKAVAFLPFGSAAAWRALHTWVGIASILFFLCHLRFTSPLGTFEIILASVFVAIVVAGVFGLVVSRSVPKRLALHGKEILFERIPEERKQIKDEFELLIRNAVREGKTELFSEYFLSKLHRYFSAPRGLILHLLNSRHPSYSIRKDIDALANHVGRREQEYLDSLSRMVDEKNHLDYCYAHQFILKYWPILHAPLAGSLMLLTLLHVLLIYSFTEI